MTVETKTSIEFADVAAFAITCRACGTEVVCRINNVLQALPVMCPNQHCGKQWLIPGDGEFRALRTMLELIAGNQDQHPQAPAAWRLLLKGGA